MKATLSTFALACAAAALSLPAAAQTTQEGAQFSSTASIQPECVVGGTAELKFGIIEMLDASTGEPSYKFDVANTSFKATCTKGTFAPKLTFTSANGMGMGFMMSSLEERLPYTLYEGNNTYGPEVMHGNPTYFHDLFADGMAHTLQISARVDGQQKGGKPVGQYSDTVTITASFGEPT